jgi:hypothetical protein
LKSCTACEFRRAGDIADDRAVLTEGPQRHDDAIRIHHATRDGCSPQVTRLRAFDFDRRRPRQLGHEPAGQPDPPAHAPEHRRLVQILVLLPVEPDRGFFAR